MATDLTVFREIVKKTLVSNIGNYQSEMLKLCSPHFDTKFQIDVLDFDGAGYFTTKTAVGAPTGTSVRAFKSSSSPVVKEQLIVLMDEQLWNIEQAAVMTANNIIAYAWNEVVSDYFSLLFAGRTTPHPDNGVSGSPIVANGGGTMYFVDNFDMTTISAGTAYTQTNDHTLALSSTNLQTVLAKRRTYRTREGKKLLNTNVVPYLVVPPELETLGKDLVAQNGRLYDGSGLQSGLNGRIRECIVAPGDATTDTTAWALVYVEQKTDPRGGSMATGPIHSHIRMVPQVRVGIPTNANDVHVLSEFAFDNFYGPNEGDLLYSKP